MSKELKETTGYEITGLTIDLMSKLRKGVISTEEFKKFLQMKTFKRREIFGVDDFSSELFEKTITLNIKKCDGFMINEENILVFLAPIIEEAKKRNQSLRKIHFEDWRYFSNRVVEGVLCPFTSSLYRPQMYLTYQEILKEAERKGINKFHTFLGALSVIVESVLAGKVNQREGVLVFFQMEGILYGINARLDGLGGLSIFIEDVIQQSIKSIVPEGCGIFFHE